MLPAYDDRSAGSTGRADNDSRGNPRTCKIGCVANNLARNFRSNIMEDRITERNDAARGLTESFVAIRRLAAAGLAARAEEEGERDRDVVELLVDGLFQTPGAARVRQVICAVTGQLVYDRSSKTSPSASPLSDSLLKEIIESTEATPTLTTGLAGLMVPLVASAGAIEWFMVEVGDEPGAVTEADLALATALRDVAAVVLAVRDAITEATHDYLTGCLNRAGLVAQLDRDLAQARRRQSRLSCVMLDVDDLKLINDAKGHHVGDAVLRCVGASLRAQRRPYDSCARYGGDEFFVILPDTGLVDAGRAAERIRVAIAANAGEDPSIDFSLPITAGVAEWREGDSLDDLVRRVDDALVATKSGGKNRVGFAR